MPSPSLHTPLRRRHHRLVAHIGRGPRRLAQALISAAENEDSDHLREVPQGAGCTEIWEHLSERREDEEADESE